MQNKNSISFTQFYTISNLLTVTRIGLIPFLVYHMAHRNWHFACIIFTAAALTDILDGFFARALNQVTVLGSYLDPLADKLLFISCYTTLILCKSPYFEIPEWFGLTVLSKEIVLIIGALILRYQGKIVMIQASKLGKFTTFMQTCFLWYICAISCFSICFETGIRFFLILIIFLMIVTLLEYGYYGYKQWRSL